MDEDVELIARNLFTQHAPKSFCVPKKKGKKYGSKYEGSVYFSHSDSIRSVFTASDPASAPSPQTKKAVSRPRLSSSIRFPC